MIVKINMGNNTTIQKIKILRDVNFNNLYMYLTTGMGEKIKIKLPKKKFIEEVKTLFSDSNIIEEVEDE